MSLIESSVRGAAGAGIPVSLCGEMASNPLAVPILIGLGIKELSGAPSAIPVVKEIVRALDAGDVAGDARAARAASTVAEVRAIGAARIRASGLLEHPDIGTWLENIVRDT
jgi:phosphoenolpyruvate-protein kinase (PTS system EI component)